MTIQLIPVSGPPETMLQDFPVKALPDSHILSATVMSREACNNEVVAFCGLPEKKMCLN